MRQIYFITLFFSVIFNTNAQELIQDNTEIKIDFKIKNLGVYAKGYFTEIAINSNFNTDNSEQSYINVTIKVQSLSTGSSKRDKHLMKSNFFDSTHYKDITLISTKIEKISDAHYKLTGKLTIKNTSKLITIPLEVEENKDMLIIKSEFNLNRRDYNVGGNIWILSNNVKIKVVYTLKR